jgi:hypothetical protein
MPDDPDPEYREWYNERKKAQTKKHLSPVVKYGLAKTRIYARSKREHKGASSKYKVEERYGDKEERKEKNLRNPYITLLPWQEAREIVLPSGMTRGQAYGKLKNSWLWFKIYRRQGDLAKLEQQAKQIRRIQADLGIKLTEFTTPFELTGQYLTPEELEDESRLQ